MPAETVSLVKGGMQVLRDERSSSTIRMENPTEEQCYQRHLKRGDTADMKKPRLCGVLRLGLQRN
jgi:hypothetical protein